MCANKNEDDTEQLPYRIRGLPPLPFDELHDSERGIPVYGVLELGRPNEQPTIDRVFLDEKAAHHHAKRIQENTGMPTIVLNTRLE